MSGIRTGVGGRGGDVARGETGVGDLWIQGNVGFGLVIASWMVEGDISTIVSVTGTLGRLL